MAQHSGAATVAAKVLVAIAFCVPLAAKAGDAPPAITLWGQPVTQPPGINGFTKNLPALNNQDIQTNLVLLSGFVHYDLFKSFFSAIPQPRQQAELLLAAKQAIPTPIPNPTPTTQLVGNVDLWNLGASTAGQITAVWERQLLAIAPNNAFTLELDPANFSPDNAYFFRLDGFQADVPVNAYQIAVSDFANGLVTRLVIGEIARAAGQVGAESLIDFPPPNMAAFNKTTFDFPKPNIWITGPGSGLNDVVDRALLNTPFHSEAILYGWYAGRGLSL